MTSARYILLLLPVLLLNACASTPSAEQAAAASQMQAAQERAAVEAELEAERLRQEQALAEDRARQAAAARETAAREAAAEAERAQQAEAARQRQQQEPSVEERARILARQQERIAELRAQIAANQTETTNLESANGALQQAVVAAEDLVTTLTAEQDKYGTTDPATGATVQALSKERIDELNAELERLQTQAAALTQQP